MHSCILTHSQKTAETCKKAVMRITHAMNGSTEESILVSHIELNVCSSLTLMHERQTNIVKLRKKVADVKYKRILCFIKRTIMAMTVTGMDKRTYVSLIHKAIMTTS